MIGLGVAAAMGTAPALAASNVVISQVYGGGGNSGATYTHDFIEIFNRGSSPADLSAMSVQYGSTAGNLGANAAQITELAGSLGPGQYLLVQEAQGAGGTTPLPSPFVTDATPIAMSATGGKVALVGATAGLNCGATATPCSVLQLAQIVDLVGYDGANMFEGSGAAPTLSNTTAALRADQGCQDTDNNAADFAAGAPTPRNQSNSHDCGVDLAPQVTATSPPSGATGVAIDANIIVTFSEPVNVTGSWYSVTCSSGIRSATVSGGPTTFTIDPDTDFAYSENCAVAIFASRVTDQDTNDPPDNMAGNYGWGFTTEAPPPPPTRIHTIQGAAHISALNGQLVFGVPGIVTGKRSNGFYMQDPDPDSDEATSEGIFVFTSSSPTSVAVGDSVRVNARVSEFRPGGSSSANLTNTELVSPTTTVLSTGNLLPAATIIGIGGRVPPDQTIEDDAAGSVETSGTFDPSSDGIDFYESLEAMRVQVNTPVAVGPRNTFGEITVVGDDGASAGVRTARGGIVIRADDFNPERIQLDDAIVPGSTPAANVGDHFTAPALGILDYDFGNFELNLTATIGVVSGGLVRETTAPQGPKQIALATFNVENLDPGDGPAKFDTLAAFIVDRLKSPDVIALEEVQDNNGAVNDGTTDSSLTLATLADAVVTAGGPLYSYRQIDPVNNQDGGEPGGNIRVAFFYRTDRGVEFVDRPGGDSVTATHVVSTPSGPQLSASPGRIDPTNSAFSSSRKPLVGEFRFRNQTFFVIANHFNSKGGDNPLFGRFQPPTRSSEVQRHQQAQLVNDFVDELLAADPNANVAALGDFNDFEFSDTIQILEGGVLHDMYETLPQSERYSYVFEGNSQTLDHMLLSDAAFGIPHELDVVHVNAEFAEQASDHDPSVLRLTLNSPPLADAGGPYSAPEGGATTVAASAEDPEGDALTYAWDLDGDGTFETPGQSVSYSAAGLDGPTTRTIAVRVTDDGGLSAVAETTVTITNVAPSADAAFGAPAVDCGPANATLIVGIADPGPDTFTAAVDWGDGSPVEALGTVGSSFAATHTYAAAGAYAAYVLVTDDDGGMGASAAGVRVNYNVTILQPLGDRAKDIFEANSTIPVKIAVADCDGSHPENLAPRIRVVKTSGTPPNQEINEPVSTSAADTTGVMRSVDSRYLYNLAAKALPDPTARYRIEITLPNGQVVTALFGLRR